MHIQPQEIGALLLLSLSHPHPPTHTPTHTPIHPHTHKQGSRRLFLSRSVIYLVRELVLDDGFSRMDMMETGKHSEKVLSIVPVHRSCTKTLTMQNFAAYSAMARTLSRRTAQDRRSCASRGGLRYRSGCRLPFLPPQRSYVQTRVPLAICQRFQCHHRWQHRRRRRRPPPVRGARGNGGCFWGRGRGGCWEDNSGRD